MKTGKHLHSYCIHTLEPSSETKLLPPGQSWRSLQEICSQFPLWQRQWHLQVVCVRRMWGKQESLYDLGWVHWHLQCRSKQKSVFSRRTNKKRNFILHLYFKTLPPRPRFCHEDKVTGPCKGYFPRFYYDEETGLCKKFIYGGCEGNNNNFKTFDECQNVCQASLQRRPKSCYEDKVVGPCRAKILRFYYDDKSGKCQRFFYGGCLGNKNNFRTDLECQKTCDAKEWIQF